MLRNLRAEMARIDVKTADIAELLSVRYGTVNDKLNGKTDFSVSHAAKIKNEFFPEQDIEYLFESKENKPCKN
ncbi:DNA-binding protein [Shouchella lonarensis]|uniref:DNA-binding protein n=1 Tax=Shouchella lonarensis TaxID=1464122 RepID=UPI000B871988|nr:DNA-binding protein [Shouchella lonarensis]